MYLLHVCIYTQTCKTINLLNPTQVSFDNIINRLTFSIEISLLIQVNKLPQSMLLFNTFSIFHYTFILISATLIHPFTFRNAFFS